MMLFFKTAATQFRNNLGSDATNVCLAFASRHWRCDCENSTNHTHLRDSRLVNYGYAKRHLDKDSTALFDYNG